MLTDARPWIACLSSELFCPYADRSSANSAYFAKFCFSLGISLKRIEVIADDEGEISETVRRMSSIYDLVCVPFSSNPARCLQSSRLSLAEESDQRQFPVTSDRASLESATDGSTIDTMTLPTNLSPRPLACNSSSTAKRSRG